MAYLNTLLFADEYILIQDILRLSFQIVSYTVFVKRYYLRIANKKAQLWHLKVSSCL